MCLSTGVDFYVITTNIVRLRMYSVTDDNSHPNNTNTNLGVSKVLLRIVSPWDTY